VRAEAQARAEEVAQRVAADSVCGANSAMLSSKDKDEADGAGNKIQARDPTVFPAWEVLRMATIEGHERSGWATKSVP